MAKWESAPVYTPKWASAPVYGQPPSPSTAPAEPEQGFFSDVGTLLKQGASQAMSTYQVGPQVISGGVEGSEGIIAKNLAAERFQPEALRQVSEAFKDEGEAMRQAESWYSPQGLRAIGGTVAEIGKQLATNPRGIAYFTAEQAANMVPAIVGGFGGAAAGAPLGPVGAMTSGAVGAFGASAPMEIGAEFIGIVGGELSARGLQPTEENIKTLLADEEFRNLAVNQARVKGATVAATDAAFSMFGGRLASAPARKAIADAARESLETGADAAALAKRNLDALPLSEKLVAGAKGYGADVVGAGVGETAGQVAAYGEADLEEVALEVLGEAGGAIVEVPGLGKKFVSAGLRTVQPGESTPVQPALTPDVELNNATNAGEAVAAAARMVDADIEALEREAGLAPTTAATPAPAAADFTQNLAAGRGLLQQVMPTSVTFGEEPIAGPPEPSLTADRLMQADISTMPAPERQEFLSELTAARTANLPEQRQQALTRAAEIYGRTVGPIRAREPRPAPVEPAPPPERLQTEGPDLQALMSADTSGMASEDRSDFVAQLNMARQANDGPVRQAALTRAAEIYGRTVGPIQPPAPAQTQAQPEAATRRTPVPRPTNILGRPASEYTESQLQTILANDRAPAITRKGVELELAARAEVAPSLPTGAFAPTLAPTRSYQDTNANFLSIPETVPVVAAQPMAGQSVVKQARATAQRTMDAWAASEGIPSPVTFGDPTPELEQGIAGVVELLGQQFGAEVVAFSDTSPMAINGVQIAGKTMVNVGSTQLGVPNTSFHELSHFFENLAEAEKAAGEKDGPAQELVEQLYSIFDDMVESGKRSYIENLLYAEELAGLTGDKREAFILSKLNDPLTRSEMVADFMGNRATDKKFLQDLAKADPTGFESFVTRWLAVLDNMLTKLRGAKGKARSNLESVKVDSYIRDLNKAKLTAQSALISYRKATQGQAAQAAAAATEAQPGEQMTLAFSKAQRGGRPERIGDFMVRTHRDGTVGVQGDPEAIRAQIPEDVKGRPVPGGMLFTSAAAPRVKNALAGRKAAYSRGGEVVKQSPMKDGKYIGAPTKYNTPAKITALRNNLRMLTKEGEAGRFWYENSSRAVLSMVGDDIQEARKFVALLSIYSPQAKVDSNSTFALRAWAQYKAGQPIRVKTKVQDGKAQRALADVDAFWSGEKTGNFYTNLLAEIDSGLPQGATIDLWMMRAAEYSNDAPTATQYAFMENETNRIAEELGWEPQQVQAAIWVAMKARMENAGVKRRTEASSEEKGWIRFDYPINPKTGKPKKTRVILDKQAHRDNWLKHAFKHDPTQDDTLGAKFDFSDGLRRHIGQLSWSAAPSPSSGLLPGLSSAPYDQQVEFQQAVQAALLDDDGVDLLAYKLGLLVDGPDILTPGEVVVGMQKQIPMAPGEKSAKFIDAPQRKALDAYAAALGMVTRNDSVTYHRPFYKGRKTDENGVEVDYGRPLTQTELLQLWTAVGEQRATDGWEGKVSFVASPVGMRVVNAGVMEDNPAFVKKVEAAAAKALPQDIRINTFSADTGAVKNDWKENPDGQNYREKILASGSPDLLGWVRDFLAPRVQAVFDEYSEKYNWGNPGQAPRFSRAQFVAWAKTEAPVIPSDKINDTDFTKPGPFVMRAFHATTHEFEAFNASVRGNRAGQFGAVNYFTSSKSDAEVNYLADGPDNTATIETRAERLADQIQDVVEDEGLEAAQEQYGEDTYDEDTLEWARNIVGRQVLGDTEQVLEVFIRTEKPFVVGEPSNQPFIEFVDFEALQQQAVERVAEDQGVDPVDLDTDEFSDQIDEARWEIESDTPNRLTAAIEKVAARHKLLDPQQLLSDLYDLTTEGARPSDLEAILRDKLVYTEDPETGDLIGNHVLGEILLELGYDSIILKNANARFKNMQMPRGTAHVHVFDSFNTNIKSVDNLGTFDPNDSRFRFSRAQVDIRTPRKNTAEAWAGKRLVGRVTAWEDSRGEFVVLRSFVRDDYRRRGIASQLYRAIEENAGKELKPAVSLSDEAFEFWKRYRPTAVAQDLRHWKDQLIGASVVDSKGREGVVAEASGGIANVRLPDGQTTVIRRDALNAALEAGGSPTIDVDGKSRQTANSKGQPTARIPEMSRTVASSELPRIDNFNGLKLRRATADIKVSAASAFADGPFGILPGVREVPLSEVALQGGALFESEAEQRRIADLARRIENSNSIEPVFIAQRADGSMYVAEGQHRSRALKALGYDSLPARIMVEGGDIRFSRAQASPMKLYSALAKAVEAGPARAPKDQWANILRKQKFVTEEEITWTGLEDWLEMQSGQVPREAVSEFLAQNGVQVGEVVLGGGNTTVHPEGSYAHPDSGYVKTLEEWYAIIEDFSDEGGPSFDEQINDLINVSGERIEDDAGDPKYDKYQLPGGTNYREVLLKLPPAKVSPPEPAQRPKVVDLGVVDGRVNYEVVSASGESLDVFYNWSEAQDFALEVEQNENIRRNLAWDKSRPKTYQSSHWGGIPNVLAHVRMNDRVDADGARVLFVEELQSDWAQEGRKKGFTGTNKQQVESGLASKYPSLPADKDDWSLAILKQVGATEQEQQQWWSLSIKTDSVPAAPFVQSTDSWLRLALKRVIAMAVEGGYDKVAFINGEQSAERYDLSKQIDSVVADEYEIAGDRQWRLNIGYANGQSHRTRYLSADELENHVGKELAKKIVDQGGGEFSGLDLKVGGEGMRAFYDNIVPKTLNKLLPKIGGGKLEQVNLESDEKSSNYTIDAEDIGADEDFEQEVIIRHEMSFDGVASFNSIREAEAWLEDNDVDVSAKRQPGFAITREMTDQVMDAGLPMFSRRQNIFGQPMPAGGWQVGDSRMDDVIYSLQDKLVDTKRVIESIKTFAGNIADKFDAYLQETLYHGRVSTRTKNFAETELDPLIEAMKRNNVTIDQIDEYLHNRHAEERNIAMANRDPNQRDGLSGITTADARAYLAAIPPARRALLEGLARRVDAITAGTRQALLDAGLESQGMLDAWENTYSAYVPLMREELDYDPAGGPGTGAGFNVRGGSSRRAVGSTDRKVVDILANVAMQRERAIVRAEKNRVSKALYGLAIQNPLPDFWLPINLDAAKDPAALQAELISLGLSVADAQNIAQQPKERVVDPRTGIVTERPNHRLLTSATVITARVNGKDRFLVLNPQNPRAERMAKALKNLDADQLGRAMGIIAQGTRWFASVNTQYNPIFGVINFLRDVQGGLLNLSSTELKGEQGKVLADTLPALRGVYADLRTRGAAGQWSQLWREFQEVGGQTGYRDQFSQSEERTKMLQAQFNALSNGTAKKAGKAVGEWLSDYNTAMENAVRLSAYKAGLDKGMSKERAAALAKNLTVNFNKKGQVATQMGALYAFFNASVQGTTRLVETLRGPAGKKIIYGGLLLGSAQALAMAMAGFDEEEPPEFTRERNIIIPTGDGKYLTVPMPLGFNVIPNFSRIVTEWALSGFERTPQRVAQIATSVFEMFNPIGNAGLSIQTLAPTVVDPIAALAENRDWTGTPIAREDFNSLDPTPGYTRAKDTASEFSKALAEFLNLASGGTEFAPGVISPTPDQLDYLIGQMTGGIGREYLKAEQTVMSKVTGEELPTYKIPLLGRFYGDTTGSSAVSSRFYEAIRRMNIHNNEIGGRREARKPVGEYLRENPEARLAPQALRTYRQVQDLRRRKREMLERGASKESIRMIEEQITRRMSQFNQRLENM